MVLSLQTMLEQVAQNRLKQKAIFTFLVHAKYHLYSAR